MQSLALEQLEIKHGQGGKTTEDNLLEKLTENSDLLKTLQVTVPRDLEKETSIREQIGKIYFDLNQWHEAIDCFQEVVSFRRGCYPLDHEQVLRPMLKLAEAYGFAGDEEECIRRLKILCSLEENKVGSDEAERLRCDTHASLARFLDRLYGGRECKAFLAEVEKELIFVYRARQKTATSRNAQADLATAALHLGRVYEEAKDYEKAEEYFSEALNLRHSFIQDDDDAALIDCQQHLAHIHTALGRTEFEEGLHLSIINRRIAKLGLGHPSTILMLGNFGFLLEANGKIEAAQAIAKKYLIPLLETGRLKIVRIEKYFSFGGHGNLGSLGHDHLFDDQKPPTEEAARVWSVAIRKHRDKVEASSANTGPTHHSRVASREALVKILLLGNEIRAASAEQAELCNAIEIASGSASPRYVHAKHEHLDILRKLQPPKDLEPLARQICDQARLLKMRELALYNGVYARLLESQGKHREAFALRRESYILYTEDVGPEARVTLASLSSLAWSAYSAGSKILAITLFEQATKRYAEVYGDNDKETAEIWHDFGIVLQKIGNVEWANTKFETACKIWRTINFVNSARTDALFRLISGYVTKASRSPQYIDQLMGEHIEVLMALGGPDHRQIEGVEALRRRFRENRGLVG